jgi:endonuclease/exonuclease/phosphatase family metal-dependent hydrolase
MVRLVHRKSPLAALVSLCMLLLPWAPARAQLDEQTPPPGQVKVVTVNARQLAVLGGSRFKRMNQLTRALRQRPHAFNGGYDDGVDAPDVIVVEEMTPSNFDVFRHLLRHRFDARYSTAGSTEVAAKILYNPGTLGVVGPAKVWTDPCETGSNPDQPQVREYEFQRFTQDATGAPLVVAGVHLGPRYSSDPRTCRNHNIRKLRNQLSGETAPTIVGGDFNLRPVREEHECDPDERTNPKGWWLRMTAPKDGGRVYKDAVRDWHRKHHRSMKDEWTFQRANSQAACGPIGTPRRGRIDYLFSSGARVAEAHADHPGWADPGVFKYSDHRFVWGRFVISGPRRPAAPVATPRKGGEIDVSWDPVPGATGWVLYRALGHHAYDTLQNLDAGQTSFADIYTEDGSMYRYSVAAVGADGGQGLESKPTKAVADAVGPRVKASNPPGGATGVDPGAEVAVYLDEPPTSASVTNHSIVVTHSGVKVRGSVERAGAKKLVFHPATVLRRGTKFKVVVSGLRDRLGNPGPRTSWSFETST